ncbi:iron complex transport system substrate-binding protein [Brevibacterium sanguinis]|uniref:Iron complex transport system substrate-binding protein n=2 Tax=Brevibacterium TaxID=1696 RepID=A0A366IK90_9MICO|nr:MULTISPECIES: ABC transporter substrate-binding protein [Brevibacterium]RBP64159.1 iron complex transport system substrate-binding protein [Brevibacterium sanguinis]RBP71549.1 iron complex transport system substrate-binding protein [Brevibacterium celere]
MSVFRRITAVVLASTMLVVSACSGSSDSPESAPPASSARTVATEQGEVEVPADPQRIVVLNYALAGYLYDMDAPVAAMTPEVTNAEGEYSEFWAEKAQKQGTTFLPWSNDGFDLEAIIEADPDLIIAGGIGFPLKHATDSYDRLQEIAPTVIVSGDKQTWQDQFSFIAADVLGRKDAYDRAVEEYDARVAEVRENITVPEGEISILSIDRLDTPYILIEGKSLSAELEPLGFRTAPLFEENDIEPYTPGGDLFAPSLEVLPDVVRSETVFVIGFNNADIGVDDLENESPYSRIPAFADGQAHDLPYWTMRGDFDEAMALLDIIEEMFTRR